MSRQRNAQLQAALARVEAGERVAQVANDMGLQTAAIYQARRMERVKAERVRADAEMRRNARRYEARRNASDNPVLYDLESDTIGGPDDPNMPF